MYAECSMATTHKYNRASTLTNTPWTTKQISQKKKIIIDPQSVKHWDYTSNHYHEFCFHGIHYLFVHFMSKKLFFTVYRIEHETIGARSSHFCLKTIHLCKSGRFYFLFWDLLCKLIVSKKLWLELKYSDELSEFLKKL